MCLQCTVIQYLQECANECVVPAHIAVVVIIAMFVLERDSKFLWKFLWLLPFSELSRVLGSLPSRWDLSLVTSSCSLSPHAFGVLPFPNTEAVFQCIAVSLESKRGAPACVLSYITLHQPVPILDLQIPFIIPWRVCARQLDRLLILWMLRKH